MDTTKKIMTADQREHIGSDRIAKRIEKAYMPDAMRMVCPPPPRNMQLEPTNICNYRCSFCASHKIKKEHQASMDPKLCERLAREAYAMGVREVGLYSRGEPFLSPDLEHYVAVCSKLGFEYIYLTTNGSLATPERLRACMENGIHSIKFSVNAASRENYASIHGHDYLDRVTEHIQAADSIRKAINRDVYLAISCVVTELTAQEEPLFMERFGTYVDTILFSPARTHGGHIHNAAAQHDDRTFCNIPFNMLNIISSGHLAACCVDFADDLVVADLREMPLAEAWHCKRFQSIRQKHLSSTLQGLQCAQCL